MVVKERQITREKRLHFLVDTNDYSFMSENQEAKLKTIKNLLSGGLLKPRPILLYPGRYFEQNGIFVAGWNEINKLGQKPAVRRKDGSIETTIEYGEAKLYYIPRVYHNHKTCTQKFWDASYMQFYDPSANAPERQKDHIPLTLYYPVTKRIFTLKHGESRTIIYKEFGSGSHGDLSTLVGQMGKPNVNLDNLIADLRKRIANSNKNS